MRILGVDPGLRSMGWGVVEVAGSRLRHVADGQIRVPPAMPLSDRLLALFDGLAAVLDAHAPTAGAVEETFVNGNARGTLKLGQARGVALLVLARAGLAIGEYAPNAVKKAVVGVGHADKAQVGHMVRMQLPGACPKGEDAADALAVAICHAHHLQTARALRVAS
ncbi:MAG: crossover junction endodeoxyribonuclease RuvC [Shimia sp.]